MSTCQLWSERFHNPFPVVVAMELWLQYPYLKEMLYSLDNDTFIVQGPVVQKVNST